MAGLAVGVLVAGDSVGVLVAGLAVGVLVAGEAAGVLVAGLAAGFEEVGATASSYLSTGSVGFFLPWDPSTKVLLSSGSAKAVPALLINFFFCLAL